MGRFVVVIALLISASADAQRLHWTSAATGGEVAGQVYLPKSFEPSASLATVVYLKNLSIPRLGQRGDDAIIAEMLGEGLLVLVLDYAKHPAAASPKLNADLLKLRRDIADTKSRSLLSDYMIDPNQLFILAEGFTLKRNVEFARDGNRVLAMDVAYPAQPRQPVPLLMEITCDNTNRMGSFSLLYCHDTLLEGAQLAGFATAMIDHPVAPPYKGIDDPMPQCVQRLAAAVEKLRGLRDNIGHNDKIGAIGFSRGGPMAALLAVQTDHPAARIQAALIHGGRYDYTRLSSDDPMLARFEKAWGPRDTNIDRWSIHGASHYLTKDAPPMFLSTSNTESKEYRQQLALFAEQLRAAGVEHVYREDQDGRGHRVTEDPERLGEIYSFFQDHLK